MLDESAPHINRTAPRREDGTGAPPAAGAAAETVEQQLDGLERHLAELQRQVQKLQRLASLGTVAAILAHEFNNLLTPIVSYSQYALTSNDPAFLRRAVEKTHRNARQLAALCTRVLGITTDDRMGPVETEIRPLLVGAVECIGRDPGKDGIEVVIEAPEDLRARAHAGSLQQVLFNLVLNARQAMLDREGRLTLEAHRAKDGRVEISVRDTGHGIRPEHRERIFEPFFSTKEHETRSDRRGIGLGLHICRQLMEEQDGSIRVESTPGAGATFTLTLPAAE